MMLLIGMMVRTILGQSRQVVIWAGISRILKGSFRFACFTRTARESARITNSGLLHRPQPGRLMADSWRTDSFHTLQLDSPERSRRQ